MVPKSEKAALDDVWHAIKVGDPSAITSYDPKLVKSAGKSNTLTALNGLRGLVAGNTLKVVSEQTTPLGNEVTVRARRSSLPTSRRRGGRASDRPRSRTSTSSAARTGNG